MLAEDCKKAPGQHLRFTVLHGESRFRTTGSDQHGATKMTWLSHIRIFMPGHTYWGTRV